MEEQQQEPERPWVIDLGPGHYIFAAVFFVPSIICLAESGLGGLCPALVFAILPLAVLKDGVHKEHKHKPKFGTSRGGPPNSISTKPRGFPKRSNNSITIHPPKDD
ncbi:MAG: hypothetical protein AAF368_09895 [Planctomycetota bacterium]